MKNTSISRWLLPFMIYTQKNKTWTHISFWDIHNICPFLGGPTMFYFCRLFFDLICGLLRPYFKNYACFWSILWREKELCIYLTKVTYTFPKLFTLNGFSSSTYTEFVWRQFLIDALGMLFDESFKQPTLA